MFDLGAEERGECVCGLKFDLLTVEMVDYLGHGCTMPYGYPLARVSGQGELYVYVDLLVFLRMCGSFSHSTFESSTCGLIMWCLLGAFRVLLMRLSCPLGHFVEKGIVFP